MSANEIPRLDEDLLYEECPDCPEDGFCFTCFDEGLVEHACSAESA